MQPIVNGLEAEFEGRAAVVRLNAGVAAERALAATYGLYTHPAFAVVDGAGQAQTFVGPQTAETLRAALAAALE